MCMICVSTDKPKVHGDVGDVRGQACGGLSVLLPLCGSRHQTEVINFTGSFSAEAPAQT